MTKPKPQKPKRKREEHPEHQPVTLDELGKFVKRLVRVPPPRKLVNK